MLRGVRGVSAAFIALACLVKTAESQRTSGGRTMHDAGAAASTSRAPAALRVALAKQPLRPDGTSPGPTTMADGGIQDTLARLGATVRVDEAALTAQQDSEYGGWKRLSMALGHFADIVAHNERDGWFTVGLLAT